MMKSPLDKKRKGIPAKAWGCESHQHGRTDGFQEPGSRVSWADGSRGDHRSLPFIPQLRKAGGEEPAQTGPEL